MRDVKCKDRITLREKKTDKERSSPINAALKSKIKKYVADKEDYVNLMRRRGYVEILFKVWAYPCMRRSVSGKVCQSCRETKQGDCSFSKQAVMETDA